MHTLCRAQYLYNVQHCRSTVCSARSESARDEGMKDSPVILIHWSWPTLVLSTWHFSPYKFHPVFNLVCNLQTVSICTAATSPATEETVSVFSHGGSQVLGENIHTTGVVADSKQCQVVLLNVNGLWSRKNKTKKHMYIWIYLDIFEHSQPLYSSPKIRSLVC